MAKVFAAWPTRCVGHHKKAGFEIVLKKRRAELAAA
jgi:hypothetical protein